MYVWVAARFYFLLSFIAWADSAVYFLTRYPNARVFAVEPERG